MTDLQGLLARLVVHLDYAGVPFMLAGSFASATHILPRTTQDIDLVIDPPNPAALGALVRSMPSDAYYVEVDTARELRRASHSVVGGLGGA